VVCDLEPASTGPQADLRGASPRPNQPELAATKSGVVGDPARLQSAILNLALNARDAMAAGGTLTISSELCERQELPVEQ
jgi:signal transduction histidine kinase